MNLQEVQDLKNSITEIRNDKNFDQGLEHIQNLVGSSNREYQENIVNLAVDSFKNFRTEFDQKINKIDNMLT